MEDSPAPPASARRRFGFAELDAHAHESAVAGVFATASSHYDLLNDAMSLGLHRLWKREMVLLAQARRGQRWLDLACGSGDLAQLLLASGCGGLHSGSAGVATKDSPDVHADRPVAASDAADDGEGADAGEPAPVSAARAPNAVVERIVDGDTIVARIADRSETLRLIGIDTPESVARTRPVQCFGKEASIYLAALLPVGADITLVRDVEARDAYDRLLVYVVRSRDGLFVNLDLVASGHAGVLNYPPNEAYRDAFARAEAEASAAGLGLWGACGGPDMPLQ